MRRRKANAGTPAEEGEIGNNAGLNEVEAGRFLDKKIGFLVGCHRRTRNISRLVTSIYSGVRIAISGLITIVLGVKAGIFSTWISEHASDTALILSASLTSLGAWEAFSDYRWRWIRYRTTLYNLYGIEDDMNFRKSVVGRLSPDESVLFYTRIMSVVHETNEEWMKQRTSSIKETGKGAAAGATPPLPPNGHGTH